MDGQSGTGEQKAGGVGGRLEGLFLWEQHQANKEPSRLPPPSKVCITLEPCRGPWSLAGAPGAAQEGCQGCYKPLGVC